MTPPEKVRIKFVNDNKQVRLYIPSRVLEIMRLRHKDLVAIYADPEDGFAYITRTESTEDGTPIHQSGKNNGMVLFGAHEFMEIKDSIVDYDIRSDAKELHFTIPLKNKLVVVTKRKVFGK